MISNYRPLIYAVIDALLLLESAGPEEVDPDTAVRGMENIASSLLSMQNSDQIALREDLLRIAGDEREPSYRDFILSLPDMIGLAAPQGD